MENVALRNVNGHIRLLISKMQMQAHNNCLGHCLALI